MNSDVGGTLRYIITADTDDFERTLRKAGKDFESFAETKGLCYRGKHRRH